MSGQQTSWDLSLARRLVGSAARQTPPDLAQRLEEEWLADLLTRNGAFARIRFGLGCCWATRVIVRDLGVAAVAGGSPASGQRLLVGHGGHDFSWFSRRSTALLAIIMLHVAAFYAYMSGVGQRVMPISPAWIHGIEIAPQPRALPPPPPLPKPTFTPTTVDSPPTPLVDPAFPPDPTAISVARPSPPHVASPLVRPVTRVPGGPGAGFPDSEDYYPPSIRRLGESGGGGRRRLRRSSGQAHRSARHRAVIGHQAARPGRPQAGDGGLRPLPADDRERAAGECLLRLSS